MPETDRAVAAVVARLERRKGAAMDSRPGCSESGADALRVMVALNADSVEKLSIYEDCEHEASKFKWIRSQEAGHDLGEAAIRRWVKEHWCGYLRARWMEHLHGKRFWVELDRGDFGLLQREFREEGVLLDRILDRLKEGQENLDILCWARDWRIPIEPVLKILETLDVNSRRLIHRFDPSYRESRRDHSA